MKRFCILALALVVGFLFSGLVIDKMQPLEFPEMKPPLRLGIDLDDSAPTTVKKKTTADFDDVDEHNIDEFERLHEKEMKEQDELFADPPVPPGYQENKPNFQEEFEKQLARTLTELQKEETSDPGFVRLPPYPEHFMYSEEDDPRAVALSIKEQQKQVREAIAKHKAEQEQQK